MHGMKPGNKAGNNRFPYEKEGKLMNTENCITSIAQSHGRSYVIAEDVIEAFVNLRRETDVDEIVSRDLKSTALPLDTGCVKAYNAMCCFERRY